MDNPEPWDGVERRHPLREQQEQQHMSGDMAAQLARMDGKLEAILSQFAALTTTQAAIDSRLRVAEVGLAELRACQQAAASQADRPPQWPTIAALVVAIIMGVVAIGSELWADVPLKP